MAPDLVQSPPEFTTRHTHTFSSPGELSHVPIPALAMNRSLLTLAGGVLLLLVAGVGMLAWLGLRAGSLGDQLVQEANRQVRATWPRPSHMEVPTPGSFGEALSGLMPELKGLYKSSDYDVMEKDKACYPVEQGTARFEDMAEPCRLMFESRREVLPRVLAATRAQTGGLPPGLTAFSAPEHPFQRGGKIALRYLLRFTGLEIRRLLSQGQPAAAVDTCLDGLALSRELALGGAYHGVVLSSGGIENLYQPCAAALDAAPPERKRQALSQLARLREGFPPLSSVLQSESVLTQLSYYGSMLSEEQLAAMEPAAAALARDSLLQGVLPGPPMLARHHWRTTVKSFDALVAVADLPPAERQKAFARIDVALSKRWFEVPPEDAAQMHEFALRADRRVLLLEALRTLVRVDLERSERGQWPATLPSGAVSPLALEATSPTEAHLKPSDTTLEGYALRLTADTPP